MKPVELEKGNFRESLGRFATGVTVVASLDSEGEVCGMTANSFSSVSLDPPMVLVCVSYQATCYQALVDHGAFTVHILQADQQQLASGFARKGADRSSLGAWSLSQNNLPILHDCKVALECKIEESYPGGDHAILLGRVLQIHQGDMESTPLLFYGGRMFALPELGATG